MKTMTTAMEIGCKTKKKCFTTREEAENFANDIKSRYPEQVQQHAYACEDCPNWHLTAMSVEAHALYRGGAYNCGNTTTIKDGEGRGRRPRHSEAERAEFVKL